MLNSQCTKPADGKTKLGYPAGLLLGCFLAISCGRGSESPSLPPTDGTAPQLTAAQEQTPPDFSGTWVYDTNRSVGLTAWEQRGDKYVVITQTTTQLVMRRMQEIRSRSGRKMRVTGTSGLGTITYALDGSESDSTYGGVRIKARSRWEGNKLITEGTQALDSEFAKFKEVRALTDNGQTMIVELSGSVAGGAEVTSRTVFKRSAGR